MICVVKLVVLFVSIVAARELTDEELHSLPKLFHLDDYERCLSQKDGVYCVGTFELTPETYTNKAYNFITEHIKQPFTFDRRLLHRGYCISSRCPSKELNTTLRFERCADKLVREHGLTARLSKLSYCTNHAERKARERKGPDLPQRIFLDVVYFIVFLNVMGTCYDLFSDGKKNSALAAWSIPGNWRRLTAAAYEGAESAFGPIQSAKVIIHGLTIFGHSAMLHYLVYSQNPEGMEKQALNSSLLITVRNGTSVVQMFLLISSFFTGYNLLQAARRSPITITMLVKWIVKRIFRLAPVYLLISAYAATWWPLAGDGPLWSPTVGAESQRCRKKFWTHVLFINNLVDGSELCLVQSWAMAADIQLFLFGLLLTVVFIKLKVRATPILAVLFTASCGLNITLAYIADLDPMVKIIVPENIRILFKGSKSLLYLHLSPSSNLPACLFGLLVAHISFEQNNKQRITTEHKEKDVIKSVEYKEDINDKKAVEKGKVINKDNKYQYENGKIITAVNGNIDDIDRIVNNGLRNENDDLDKGNRTLLVNGRLLKNVIVCANKDMAKSNGVFPTNINGKIVKINSEPLNTNVEDREFENLASENCGVPNTNGKVDNCKHINSTLKNIDELVKHNVSDHENLKPYNNGAIVLSEKTYKLIDVNGVHKGYSELSNGNDKKPSSEYVNKMTSIYKKIYDRTIGLNNKGHVKPFEKNYLFDITGLRLRKNPNETNGFNKSVEQKRIETNNNINGIKYSFETWTSQNTKEAPNSNGLNGHITVKGTGIYSNRVKDNAAITMTNGYDEVKSPSNEIKESIEYKTNGKEIKSNGSEIKNVNRISYKEDQPNENISKTIEEGKKEIKYPLWFRYAHCFTIPSLIAWVMLGTEIMSVESKILVALYVGMERLMFSLMTALQLLQIVAIKGPWGKFLSWQGWTVPGRLSLSMTMVHWCVSATFVAARPQPVFSTVFYISMDWLTTVVCSYILAVPLYVFVEMPARRCVDALIS